MIRFRLSELIAEKQFSLGRRLTINEVAEATGINRITLSRMMNRKGYSTVTDNLDKLCEYFDCQTGDVVVYVKDMPDEIEPCSAVDIERNDATPLT